ncbi:autotransporter outer membrane beta-barrel domain-containing protein [Gallibacterium salpingitidis]|uniref:autotransporter outer membrane beta-barrel domain-containing protein n=1 Tax=Gallibacterium salpingitidis TaxID=505341 RepID=UPI00266F4A64|nr:autotransporter outer membrane beta-barrel domain-containing protein [Gallibacterium salpingitidis]WKT00015.1 autotransporter outer membrane beta-barrel domain-containing protein [Gallibacterium salpingitidis]
MIFQFQLKIVSGIGIINARGRAADNQETILLKAKGGDNTLTIDEISTFNQEEFIFSNFLTVFVSDAKVVLSAEKGTNSLTIGNINSKAEPTGKIYSGNGISFYPTGGSVELVGQGNKISLYTPNFGSVDGIDASNSNNIEMKKREVKLEATDNNNELTIYTTNTTLLEKTDVSGINGGSDSFITLSAEKGKNSIKIGDAERFSEIAGQRSFVTGINQRGIGDITAIAKQNEITLYAPNAQVQRIVNVGKYFFNKPGGNVKFHATGGDNKFTIQTTAFKSAGATVSDDSQYIRGINTEDNSKVEILASGTNSIQIGNKDKFAQPIGETKDISGIYSYQGIADLTAQNNSISVYAPNAKNRSLIMSIGAVNNNEKTITLTATATDNLLKLQTTATNQASGYDFGINAQSQAQVLLSAQSTNRIEVGDVENTIPDLGDNFKKKINGALGIYTIGSNTEMHGQRNEIAMYAPNASKQWLMYAYNVANATDENTITLNAKERNVLTLDASKVDSGWNSLYGIQSVGKSTVSLSANQENRLLITDKGNQTGGAGNIYRIYGLMSQASQLEDGTTIPAGKISAIAPQNHFTVDISNGLEPYLLYADGETADKQENIQVVAQNSDNLLEIATTAVVPGYEYPIYGMNNQNKGQISLSAEEGSNTINIGDKSHLATLSGTVSEIYAIRNQSGASTKLLAKNNSISVYAPNAKQQYLIYAEDEAQVTLMGTDSNTLTGANVGIYANNQAEVKLSAANNTLLANKFAIQSYNQSQVSIDGKMRIEAPWTAYTYKGNIALNYEKDSVIKGHMLSIGGDIQVKSKGSTLHLTGNQHAYDNGNITLQLTPGSLAVGRMDNFAAYDNAQHKTLFGLTPTASNAGQIHLELAKDSLWQMTGQSWISELRGEGTVDVSPTSAGALAGQALHIDKLAGANQFLMTLNKTGQGSDMLYIKEGTSTPQDIVIKNLSVVVNSMDYGERLRFATVQTSHNEFVEGKVYGTTGDRLFKQALTVEYADQATDPDNREAYNLAFNGGNALSKSKPSNEYVNSTYGGDGSQNVYLVKYRTNTPSRNTVDIGRMLDASAGYAFTLDTYTKREGERAYSLNEIKEGAWIRGTHTRLKEAGRFSLNNNDYEIGYDKFRYNNDEKKQKWGLSFTYSYGKTTLADEFSKGRVKKYELSLYNTNQWNNQAGDNSYYNDNVLRVGTLHNHYQAVMSDGSLWGKGSYKNYLFTASTEHGYRKFIDDEKRWYLVPQAQLQFAYLTGADYRTSNDIDVKLGHAKSLIGRAGVDIVRLLDENGDNRLYLKGNVLHEFLGKRSFSASDRTGDYHTSWNIRGTWYAVGVGYNAHVSEKTNVFIDAEKEFGHGRTGSYNLRLALSWQFK